MISLNSLIFGVPPKLAPILGYADAGPSASKLQVSCNGAASVAEGELLSLSFLEFLVFYCDVL